MTKSCKNINYSSELLCMQNEQFILSFFLYIIYKYAILLNIELCGNIILIFVLLEYNIRNTKSICFQHSDRMLFGNN